MNQADPIFQRFQYFLLDMDKAIHFAGIEVEGRVTFDKTEQANSRRELLRVERLALRDKELNRKSEENYVEGIRDMVHAEVLNRMEIRVNDFEEIYAKLIGIDENLPDLLDILSVKASSISRVEPIAGSIPWLFDDLIKLVNMPKYRRTDAKGRVVAVDTLRVALSFLGIENLRMVIPALAFRRWIPQITDPFPQIKTRVWEQAIGTATACKRIAQISKLDEASAFTLGMFHQIGQLAVIRLYFRLFESVQREALIEAHTDKKREEHSALGKIEPSAKFLVELIDKFALGISAKVIHKMDMQRVFISTGIEEFAKGEPLNDMTPMGQILSQGSAYCKYRMLKSAKMISVDEAKTFLRQFHMPTGALAALKTTDLRSLNLTMEEVSK